MKYLASLLLIFTLSFPCFADHKPNHPGKGNGGDPPEPTIVGLLFFDGAEGRNGTSTASRYPWYDLNSSVPDSSTTFRTGARSFDFSIANASGATCSVRDQTLGGTSPYDWNKTAMYVSFYLNIDSSGTAETRILDLSQSDQTTMIAQLGINTDNTLFIRPNTGSDIDGSIALSNDTWYRVDCRIDVGTSGNYELKINGTTDVSGTANFGTSNIQIVNFRGEGSGSTFADFFIDDIVLRDDQFQSDGDNYGIHTLLPDGDGNYTDWTGSYLDLDEPWAIDGNEVFTSTNNDRFTVTLDNLPGGLDIKSIDAVLILGIIRRSSNPTCSCEIIDRLSSTDRDTTSFEVDKAELFTGDNRVLTHYIVYDTKPGGGAFTETDINSYEIGLQHAQAQSRELRCTAMRLNVLVTVNVPPSAGIRFKQSRNTLLRM
jgi:hypothetical protein